jgi:hypothetical protein
VCKGGGEHVDTARLRKARAANKTAAPKVKATVVALKAKVPAVKVKTTGKTATAPKPAKAAAAAKPASDRVLGSAQAARCGMIYLYTERTGFGYLRTTNQDFSNAAGASELRI